MKTRKKILATIGISGMILLVLPMVVFAANTGIKSNVFNPTILQGPLLICTGSVGPALGNQYAVCSNVCDLVAQIANIIYFMIAVILWIVTPILITVGGVMIMLAGASPEMVSRGKGTITGAIWGVVIILCAWVIVATFVKVIGITGIGGFGVPACSIAGS